MTLREIESLRKEAHPLKRNEINDIIFQETGSVKLHDEYYATGHGSAGTKSFVFNKDNELKGEPEVFRGCPRESNGKGDSIIIESLESGDLIYRRLWSYSNPKGLRQVIVVIL